jgi:hypothetical protein
MTLHGLRTRVLFGLDAFCGVTEILGGIGLLSGLMRPSLSLLKGSPFSDFTVPGLALTTLGLGTLLAAGLLPSRRDLGLLASVGAGGFLAIYEICEVLTFGLNPLTAFYLIVGALIVVLGLLEWQGSNEEQAITRTAA